MHVRASTHAHTCAHVRIHTYIHARTHARAPNFVAHAGLGGRQSERADEGGGAPPPGCASHTEVTEEACASARGAGAAGGAG
eukprot:1157851-Pelagomonas_calceolata.AAC.1